MVDIQTGWNVKRATQLSTPYCSLFPFLFGEVDVPQLATGQPKQTIILSPRHHHGIDILGVLRSVKLRDFFNK
ncbi:unnamed protein product [Brugia pahangi]|uniref:Uncharacterized protein n=1 Tax=Brugia pahangi TaxID=6280 RepID=A0A0N4TQT6_BRUPA|nr:unnamed protein product [Brugia pahangi]